MAVRRAPPGLARVGAAGILWTSRTATAQWPARYAHTSVITAAGAIYVIGGNGGGPFFRYLQDVWVSTDGGAQPGLFQGGGIRGLLRGYSGVLRRVLEVFRGVLRGTSGGT